jgi:hypothetical protein
MKPGWLVLAIFVSGLGCIESEGDDHGFDAATVDIRPRVDAWSQLERPDAGPLKGSYEEGGRPKHDMHVPVEAAAGAASPGAARRHLPNAPLVAWPAPRQAAGPAFKDRARPSFPVVKTGAPST